MSRFTLNCPRTTALGLAAVAVTTLLVTGCGGGDDDDTSVKVTAVTLSPATLTPPPSGTVTFRIGFTAELNYYPEAGSTSSVLGHILSPGANGSAANDANRIVRTTCQPFGFAGCTSSCTFGSTRTLTCNAKQLDLAPGSYTLPGRACIKMKSGGNVCADNTAALTVR